MPEPLLHVSDLSVRYSKRREVTTALRDVSFSLGKEIVTIIGPSGSGKSSLLHALAGIIRPRKGTLQLSGAPLSPRTHQIALVPQQYGLFPWKTVRESIHLPAALGKRIVSSDLQE
ncbi:MAG: ATP-binding cassette domain-containing protein, partial [Porphyromonadaceae bacterium]|nr:ATP-binding cassette domain-containing protein [Porphyromonadaceae bacterium]